MLTSPLSDQYRPPGRSNRSGRAGHSDNDVFEGLPVKQWGHSISHISLAPPKSEHTNPAEADKWGEPPMPRDYQLLQPWTQQLLRLARSGKIGTKRKPDPDSMDDDKPEDDAGDDAAKTAQLLDDRGFVAKKWKPVPEALLEPEHKHFEFLAKRRKGLPSLYGPDQQNGAAAVAMRKTKVQKAGPNGEVAVYEVLVAEGAAVEGEVTADSATEVASLEPVHLASGTVIEGIGIANDEGVVVAEQLLKPSIAAPRRNRPPPKKKGGPGRGKKRVTFTNPDGSTYTTVVPNATKIVPQPGQTVKHVAKGEEATADVSTEQAAATADSQPNGEGEGEGEGEDGEEGEGEGSDDEGDDDDDREEGELSDDEAHTGDATPNPAKKIEGGETTSTEVKTEDVPMEDTEPPVAPIETPTAPTKAPKPRDASSSPELPLAKTSHSRQNSLNTPTAPAMPTTEQSEEEIVGPTTIEEPAPSDPEPAVVEAPGAEPEDIKADEPEIERFEDGEEDLLGNLEKSLVAPNDEANDKPVEAPEA